IFECRRISPVRVASRPGGRSWGPCRELNGPRSSPYHDLTLPFGIPVMRHMLLVGLAAALAALPVAAQEKKSVEIRWFGHSFFQLTTTAGTKVAFDPHAISEYGIPQLSPDIVVMSHNHNDHNRKEILTNAGAKDLKAFYGVTVKGKGGEWAKIDEKVKDVRVRTVGTYHDAEEGAKKGKNSVFIVEADGLKFCHLGDLGHELTDEQ